jgi:hypothetical protein
MKLGEEAISEILVADTESESRVEDSNVEEEFEEEEDLQHQLLLQQPSAADETQAAIRLRRITTLGTSQGRNTNFHSFVGPAKGVKKARLHTSTKTARHCLC